MPKILATAALAAALLVGAATAVSANPGPGNSHSCAPGQQGNQDPGFKPGACDN
jgi:hypothetical protein